MVWLQWNDNGVRLSKSIYREDPKDDINVP